MDVEVLSRLQFAFTVAFHYIYPPLSIGLGLVMVVMEGLYLRTGNDAYHRLARFWTKIFALTFGIGVATGIVMEFEFGTNWARYSRFVGDIFGGPLAAEGIFAFFLESGFLAILLFGCHSVPPGPGARAIGPTAGSGPRVAVPERLGDVLPLRSSGHGRSSDLH